MANPWGRSPRWWADTAILIGAAYLPAFLRGLLTGTDLPRGLDVLTEGSRGNEWFAGFAAAGLVYHLLQTRGPRRAASHMVIGLVLVGVAAYPAVEELVTSHSPLRAAVRSLPVLLSAALTYGALKIADRVRPRKDGPRS